MQYILTEEEKRALVPRRDLDAAKEAIKLVGANLLETAGFRCIHDRAGAASMGRRELGYCDDCPLSRLMYVRDAPDSARLLCERPKNHSK